MLGSSHGSSRIQGDGEEEVTCGRLEVVRDFEIETVGFSPTGRSCNQCGRPMVDNTLDWDSPLPDEELEAAIEEADRATVQLVLGTSLQISPSNELPLITHRSGGKVVIVNLQKTPRDKVRPSSPSSSSHSSSSPQGTSCPSPLPRVLILDCSASGCMAYSEVPGGLFHGPPPQRSRD